MTTTILKSILAGAIFGTITFFAFKVILFFIVCGLLMKLFFGRRNRHFRGGLPMHKFAFADNIRNMSEEEYHAFKDKASNGCGHHHYHNTNKNK
jgi:hypothetical protein